MTDLAQEAVAAAEYLRRMAADDPLAARELCYWARRLELAAMGGSPGMARLGPVIDGIVKEIGGSG